MNLLKKAHQGQFRKDGKPYFSHVEAVADILKNQIEETKNFNLKNNYDKIIATAYLHDVVEDCGVTTQDLMNAGFSETIIGSVLLLSRKNNENYFDFIMRIKNSTNCIACEVKIADLLHNMSDLKEGSLKDKYRFALHILRIKE